MVSWFWVETINYILIIYNDYITWFHGEGAVRYKHSLSASSHYELNNFISSVKIFFSGNAILQFEFKVIIAYEVDQLKTRICTFLDIIGGCLYFVILLRNIYDFIKIH